MNYNKIHIGQMIEKRASECRMDTSHICNFLKITEDQTNLLFRSENISTEILLRLSKFLNYDFFRIYSQHIILYAPTKANKTNKSELPHFRKNIYTTEIINFIIERFTSGEMTKSQIIERYKIPKTTLYKWIEKYKN